MASWLSDFFSTILGDLWNHRLDFLFGRVSVREYILIIFFMIISVVVGYILKRVSTEIKNY